MSNPNLFLRSEAQKLLDSKSGFAMEPQSAFIRSMLDKARESGDEEAIALWARVWTRVATYRDTVRRGSW